MSAATVLYRPSATASLPAADLLHFEERRGIRWIFLAADIVMLELSLLLGLLLRQLILPPTITLSQLTGMAVGILVAPLLLWLVGLYPGTCLGPAERLRRRTYVTVAVFAALTAWDNIVLRGMWSRGVLLSALVFAITLPPLVEAAVRGFLIRRRWWGTPVILLGAGSAGRALARIFREEPQVGLKPVGFFDDDPRKWGTDVEGVPVVGPVAMAQQYRQFARMALVTMPSLPHRDLCELLGNLGFARIIIVPNLLGIQSQWVTARDLGGYLGLEIRKNLLIRKNWMLKRVMDYVLGIPGLLVSLPIIGLAALWIKRRSPGPAFYSQERIGLDGKRIQVWKLRTMHLDSDRLLREHLASNELARIEWNSFFKLRKDPRIIPGVGHFLRKTSLDELPQFWNIMRGDMSLVGPRPFPEYHLAEFPAEFRELRSSVLPGLTGLWQVARRSDGDLEVQQALDTYLIRNWSIWIEIYVLARTVRSVLGRSGAY